MNYAQLKYWIEASPRTVFFGGAGVFEEAESEVRQADLLIVGGTSLAVYPATGLLNYFHGSHLVLINKSETPYDSMADLVIHDPIGQVFSGMNI